MTQSFSFEAIRNFRDLGGLRAGGRKVKHKLVFRSGSLSEATDRDLNIITELNLRTVVDLRSLSDAESHPDRLPVDGTIQVVAIPLVKRDKREEEKVFPQLHALRDDPGYRGDGSEVMKAYYKSVPRDFSSELRQFLHLVGEPTNLPVLCHCHAGKDRTGIFIAVLLKLLGVADSHIIEDYLLSNDDDLTGRVSLVSAKFDLPLLLARSVAEVRVDYIEGALQTIRREYDGMNTYVRNVIGLTDKEIDQLSDTLLES